jgi:hypothetical protein
MAQPQLVNEYKVTVISKYKDFDGMERESKTTKTVYAKTENGAIGKVTKKPKKLVHQPKNGAKEITESWNDRGAQYVTDTNISVELIKENITVII